MIEGLGIVDGLAQEAACARSLAPDVRIGITGATREGAERAIASLIGRGVTDLLSFGLAGGLDPALGPGALLLPDAVLVGEERLAVDERLRTWLRGTVTGHAGSLLHSDSLVFDPTVKARLRDASQCCALDMESGHVALLARDHGLGFAVLRVVCDDHDSALPPAARIPLDSAGRIRPLAIAGSILRHPGQIADLVRLGRDAAIARTTLRRAIATLRDHG